jgi:polyhydroxyalkanoate synthesis regulator phasin
MAQAKSSSGRTQSSRSGKRRTAGPRSRRSSGARSDGLQNLVELLANRIIKPLGLVVLSRERIQDTLDEAAERGCLTRSDANDLVAELVHRGRQQTDELLSDLERLLGSGRARITKPIDRLVRSSRDQEDPLPIPDYDELLARQVQERLEGLAPPELRRVRDYERRHANRKSVLASIERQLG